MFSPLRIIVQNLSFETTKEELTDKFAALGTVVDTVIAVDASGRSRGFGFVTFDSPEPVNKAVAEGAVFELSGRTLRVQVANQKKESRGGERGAGGGGGGRVPRGEIKAQGPKLYCGDLPWELSAEELSEHFEKFGKVVNAYLAEVQYAHSVNGYKPHRGFGFVEFSSEEEATAALRTQHTIKGANVRVTSAKGEAKGGDDRKRRKERPNTNNAGEGTEGTHKKAEKKDSGSGKEGEQDRPPRTTQSGEKKGRSTPPGKTAEAKPAAAAAAPAPSAAAAVPKKGGVKVAAAPKENPWSKKGDAASGEAAANAAEFPTLGDVTSGKVKLRKKTEDEIAQEIAQERAKEKKAVEGKGKEELE